MEPSHKNAKRAFLIVLVIFGLLFLKLLAPVLMALCVAIITAILLYPVYQVFLKRFRKRAYLASFVTTALLFLLLILPLSIVALLTINQSLSFFSQSPVRSFFSSVESLSLARDYFIPLIESWEAKIGVSIDLVGLLSDLGTQLARYLYSFSPHFVGQAATFIFNFIIMHFCLFFLFIDGPKVFRVILDLSPLEQRYESRLTSEFKNMLNATVYGYLFTALVQAVLAGIAYAVVGVPAPVVFAALTFFMSLVPIVGTASVWLPLGLYLLLQDHMGSGVGLIIYGAVIISGIDNILKPWIMRGKANVHILLIFFSLLGGLKLFGPIGILFGPVITALFLACIRIYREDYLKPAGI